MTVLAGAITAADVLKELDPKLKPVRVVEMLRKENSFYDDARWKMCNGVTKHQASVRTSLPTSTKRKDNQGVAPTHGTSAQITDDTTSFVQYSTVDCSVADRYGNSFEYRASQGRAHIMGLTNDVQEELIYGNLLLDPNGINGLSARYDAIGPNVIDGGGVGDTNISAWFWTWCDEAALLYPENSVLGVEHLDKGRQTIPTALNGPVPELMDVYMDRWEQRCGLTIENWRRVARVCNVDVNLLGTGGAADIHDLFTDAYHALLNPSDGNLVVYVGATMFKYIDKQAREGASFFDVEKVQGKVIHTYRGHPLRVIDALDTLEEQVI